MLIKLNFFFLVIIKQLTSCLEWYQIIFPIIQWFWGQIKWPSILLLRCSTTNRVWTKWQQNPSCCSLDSRKGEQKVNDSDSLVIRFKIGEIIPSSGGPCHLCTIPLKNSHLFKIAKSVISGMVDHVTCPPWRSYNFS